MNVQSSNVADKCSETFPGEDSVSGGPSFVLVAGEASGDALGADLIEGLRMHFPTARFSGIGGAQMAAAGMAIWHPAETLSVMGLFETLPHIPRLLAIRRNVFQRTLREQPVAFIGIDAPDFNLGLERKLKHRGLRTVHYVSPSIWAWREKRAERIGRSTDCVLCLFPMEPAIYARHHVDARFVGHPLAREFPLHPDQAAARRALALPADVPLLAILPGSRLGEIRRLGTDFIAAARLLKRQIPRLHVAVPMTSPRCRDQFQRLLDSQTGTLDDLHLFNGRSHEIMIASDAVLLASGTAALEAMLAKRPMVVAYRLARLTYRLVRAFALLRTDVYSLPNILAGERIVPELMQDACTPEALADELLPFLQTRRAPVDLTSRFEQIHRMLIGDPAHNAAAQISNLVGKTP